MLCGLATFWKSDGSEVSSKGFKNKVIQDDLDLRPYIDVCF
jgi:hypothetical protein